MFSKVAVGSNVASKFPRFSPSQLFVLFCQNLVTKIGTFMWVDFERKCWINRMWIVVRCWFNERSVRSRLFRRTYAYKSFSKSLRINTKRFDGEKLETLSKTSRTRTGTIGSVEMRFLSNDLRSAGWFDEKKNVWKEDENLLLRCLVGISSVRWRIQTKSGYDLDYETSGTSSRKRHLSFS